MSKELLSLENIPWQIIKNHLSDPDHIQLSEEHRNMLDRVFSMQRILQRYPQPRTALALHQAKFPDISRRTAYNDLNFARELDNTYHSFDYEFYNNWLISDIFDQIQAAKAKGDMKAWAAGHANLKKAIGERPMVETDPKLLEKHTFLIQINNMAGGIQMNIDEMEKLPAKIRQEIADAVFEEITDEQAEQMINS
jgi:hypothetical protein